MDRRPGERIALIAFAGMMLLLPTVLYGQSDMTNGLVGWWKLDGNGIDSSPYGNNGIVVGATSTADRFGATSAALQFYTNYDCNVWIPSSPHPTGEVSVTYAAWILQTARTDPGTQCILDVGDGKAANDMRSGLLAAGDHLYYVGEGNDSQLFNATFPAQTWTHVCVTKSGTSVYAYVNGMLRDQGVTRNGQHLMNTQVFIGRANDNNGTNAAERFAGNIDEVRIYNRALSSNEVALLYLYHDGAGLDTDGDGMPDWWEIANGLNPEINDADRDNDLDWVSNFQEFLNNLCPTNAQTHSGTNDYEFLYGQTGARYTYDRNDRLVGVDYERGLSLGYTYDGNGNITRQVAFTNRDADGDGLPDLWEFLNGLSWTNAAAHGGMYGDPDGDGWSNFQEWQAGTSPTNAASIPDIYGSAGTTAATFQVGFTPSNFVMAVGQLDGQGAEEIVIGADGNPGTVTNAILILSQTFTGWATQRVDVGAVGITSIAIGQPTNTDSAAIYLGTRDARGTGAIIRVKQTTTGWVPTTVAVSTSAVAYVLGVRPAKDIMLSFGKSNSVEQCLSALSCSNGTWTLSTYDTNSSHRGLGTMAYLYAHDTFGGCLRLLDSGGIQVISESLSLPADAVYSSDYDAWFFLSPGNLTWSNAQSYAEQFGGDLVTIDSPYKNSWLSDHFGTFWIGLSHASSGAPWHWTSGAPVVYTNWAPGEPNCNGGTELYAHMLWNQLWGDGDLDNGGGGIRGLAEVPFGSAIEVSVTMAEPTAVSRLLWRGKSVSTGHPRGDSANSSSVLYTCIDDVNSNGISDVADRFVLAEYLLSGTNCQTGAVVRVNLVNSLESCAYGLASVNYVNSSNEVVFTGEPDGNVYSWISPSATGALQRQLFSAKYAGKAWHQLEGHRGTGTSGAALAGLCVDPATPSTCSLIYWPPQQTLWTPQQIKQTPPVTRIMDSPNSGAGLSIVRMKIWDAEGNPSLPHLQVSSAGTNNWTDATALKLDGMNYSYSMAVAAMPTGCVHDLLWNSGVDLGPGFSSNIYLRARSRDMDTGAWSDPVLYHVEVSDDSNHDGIPDAWCMQYGLDPLATNGASYSTGSADGTGTPNLYKYIADLDPTNPLSRLELTGLDPLPAGMRVHWHGGQWARQYLETRTGLVSTSEQWTAIFTNLPPTATVTNIVDAGATNTTLYYRIRAER